VKARPNHTKEKPLMARTIRNTETTARSTKTSRAELLQRIQQREQSWELRSEILPILRR
jgi:hypothetical protein